MRKSLIVVCLTTVLLMAAVAAFPGNRSDDPLGIAVSPQTLILNWEQGGSVTVHTDLPYSLVDLGSLELSGVPVWWTKADDRGCLVAFFPEDDVKALVAPPSAVLTLHGFTVDDEEFAGSDTVTVMYRNR